MMVDPSESECTQNDPNLSLFCVDVPGSTVDQPQVCLILSGYGQWALSAGEINNE